MSNAQGFFGDVYSAARAEGATPTQASLAASQASLETGFGKSVKGNSYFGIKAGTSYKGPKTNFATHEVFDGKKTGIRASFRSYRGLKESVKDYMSFMEKAFPEAWSAPSLSAAVKGLGKGKYGSYATDPNYADKVASIGSKYGKGVANQVTTPTARPTPIAGVVRSASLQAPTPSFRAGIESELAALAPDPTPTQMGIMGAPSTASGLFGGATSGTAVGFDSGRFGGTSPGMAASGTTSVDPGRFGGSFGQPAANYGGVSIGRFGGDGTQASRNAALGMGPDPEAYGNEGGVIGGVMGELGRPSGFVGSLGLSGPGPFGGATSGRASVDPGRFGDGLSDGRFGEAQSFGLASATPSAAGMRGAYGIGSHDAARGYTTSTHTTPAQFSNQVSYSPAPASKRSATTNANGLTAAQRAAFSSMKGSMVPGTIPSFRPTVAPPPAMVRTVERVMTRPKRTVTVRTPVKTRTPTRAPARAAPSRTGLNTVAGIAAANISNPTAHSTPSGGTTFSGPSSNFPGYDAITNERGVTTISRGTMSAIDNTHSPGFFGGKASKGASSSSSGRGNSKGKGSSSSTGDRGQGMAGAGGGGGGGDTYLCTVAHEFGWIDAETLAADGLAGQAAPDWLYGWYSSWAPQWADVCRASPIARTITLPIISIWAKGMALLFKSTFERA